MPGSELSAAFKQLYSGVLTSPNAQADGYFGASVAISGTTVIVGAPYENASGDRDAGHAYIFNAKTGALISTLTSPNTQFDGWFGRSVAVSGTTLVVGAPLENVSNNPEAGHAYIFNATTGALISTLTSPNAQYAGWFGFSVGVCGRTVIVGAYGETASGYVGAGNAYAFNAQTGALILTLTSPYAQNDGSFGFSVGVSGRKVVVGAPYEKAAEGLDVGRAYAFSWRTGAWLLTLLSPKAQPSGLFGFSVAITDKMIVVGAPLENTWVRNYSGHAYTFHTKTGVLISTIVSPFAQFEGGFGTSVAISGTTVVVGAPLENVTGFNSAGHAYTIRAKTTLMLISPNPQPSGLFGTSVAISGTKVVVGATGQTVARHDGAGAAYAFRAKKGVLI